MIEIWLEGRSVGKGRPRLGRDGRVHLCDRYSTWKSDAVSQLLTLNIPEAPKPAMVQCFFVNFFSSDADNLVGSVLDALVEAGILGNDSSSYVVGCSGKFAKTQKKRCEPKPIGVLVRISSAEIECIELEAIADVA